MNVNVIMIPKSKTKCIKADDTIGNAIKLIDENGLLSLPVVEGEKVFGVLSKRYVYEQYFKEENVDREEFLGRLVRSFIKTKLTTLREDVPIEEAAATFINSKVPFIPVVGEQEELLGIITYQAIFKEYQKLFGTSDHHTIIILSYDFRGKLAKIAEVIAKNKGNIKNIVARDTEVLGVHEITLKVDCPDLDKLVRELEKHGFEARWVIRANKKEK